jgi:hypothetical protein
VRPDSEPQAPLAGSDTEASDVDGCGWCGSGVGCSCGRGCGCYRGAEAFLADPPQHAHDRLRVEHLAALVEMALRLKLGRYVPERPLAPVDRIAPELLAEGDHQPPGRGGRSQGCGGRLKGMGPGCERAGACG